MKRQAPTDPTLPTRCPCPAGGPIVAVKPGQDATRRGAIELFTRQNPLVEGAVADRFWCAACAPWWKARAA
jgi:hypothetical protein